MGILILAVAFVVTSFHRGEPPPSALPKTITALHQEMERIRQQHRRVVETNRQLQQTIQAFGQSEGLPLPEPDEGNQVDRERAIAIATNYLGGGTVVEVEREQEHGSLVYEVTFHDESKVYVEVASGRVVYAHIRDASGDDDDDEDDDDEDNDEEGEDDD